MFLARACGFTKSTHLLTVHPGRKRVCGWLHCAVGSAASLQEPEFPDTVAVHLAMIFNTALV
jgi:hypothetical protein